MLNNKDYCNYETSIALYELGYDCQVIHLIAEKITLYEAQKWLREAKDVLIIVCPYTYNIIDKTHTWTCEIWFGDNLEYEMHDFKSYEEALSEGVREAVKLLKEK
jgi:hypothetical protein